MCYLFFVVFFKQNSQAKLKIEVEHDRHIYICMVMFLLHILYNSHSSAFAFISLNYSAQFLIVLFILLKFAKHIFTTNQELLSELAFENYSTRGNSQPIKIIHSWVALDSKRVSVQWVGFSLPREHFLSAPFLVSDLEENA